MNLTFIETVAFTKALPDIFGTDEAFRRFQEEMLADPDAGTVMPGCGGLRKIRWADRVRGKGTRGGVRIIYLHVPEAHTVLLLMAYRKNVADNLTVDQQRVLASLADEFRAELKARKGIRTKNAN